MNKALKGIVVKALQYKLRDLQRSIEDWEEWISDNVPRFEQIKLNLSEAQNLKSAIEAELAVLEPKE
jgi:hypothetical protein